MDYSEFLKANVESKPHYRKDIMTVKIAIDVKTKVSGWSS